jgi:two-component system cell cycle sensor histidine kinase/response regulator CckA
LQRQTLLVVEDSDSIRRLMVRKLTQAGFAVIEAGSGPEALRVLDEHPDPIDILITDLSLPVMDGMELFLEMRARQPKLPVLFVSGAVQEGMPETFLAKPFGLDELVARVRLLLEKQGGPPFSGP